MNGLGALNYLKDNIPNGYQFFEEEIDNIYHELLALYLIKKIYLDNKNNIIAAMKDNKNTTFLLDEAGIKIKNTTLEYIMEVFNS